MKIEYMRCDGCGKNNVETEKAVLPIFVPASDYETGDRIAKLVPKEMDLCVECAEVIARAYYKNAEEHSFSGLRGIYE